MDKKKKPYALRVISHTARLPQYISYFERTVDTFSSRLSELQALLGKQQEALDSINKRIENLSKKNVSIDQLDDRIADLEHITSTSTVTKKQATVSQEETSGSIGHDKTFDLFYKRFEDKFRGSPEQIRKRLEEHLPLFDALPKHIKEKPVVDVGFGRCEFLSLLTDHGFSPVGVDINTDMVTYAQKQGYTAILEDARQYLAEQKASSLAAVTGFHIVEHLPFEVLMGVFKESYRALERGGFVLFETPNPRSLSVGANTFYIDPSHERPIPSELLSFMLEYSGFSCEVIPLHEIPTTPEVDAYTPLKDIIFGYADYAVVGRKL